jgi:hypothetical protein
LRPSGAAGKLERIGTSAERAAPCPPAHRALTGCVGRQHVVLSDDPTLGRDFELADVIDGRLAGIDKQPAAPLMLFGSL